VIPIHSQARDSLEDMLAFEEAKAMTHYNKPQGGEAVLYAELSEKRQRLGEMHPAAASSLASGSMAAAAAISGAGEFLLSKKCYFCSASILFWDGSALIGKKNYLCSASIL
jgi:hypothetical protein